MRCGKRNVTALAATGLAPSRMAAARRAGRRSRYSQQPSSARHLFLRHALYRIPHACASSCVACPGPSIIKALPPPVSCSSIWTPRPSSSLPSIARTSPSPQPRSGPAPPHCTPPHSLSLLLLWHPSLGDTVSLCEACVCCRPRPDQPVSHRRYRATPHISLFRGDSKRFIARNSRFCTTSAVV